MFCKCVVELKKRNEELQVINEILLELNAWLPINDQAYLLSTVTKVPVSLSAVAAAGTPVSMAPIQLPLVVSGSVMAPMPQPTNSQPVVSYFIDGSTSAQPYIQP